MSADQPARRGSRAALLTRHGDPTRTDIDGRQVAAIGVTRRDHPGLDHRNLHAGVVMQTTLTIVPWADPIADTIGAGMSLTQTRE